MKKEVFVLLGMVCLSFGLLQTVTAQERIVANKRHITRTVEVGSFDHIRLNGSSELFFTPTSGKQHLKLTLPNNLVDVVQVYVKDRTLVLEMKPHTSVVLKNGSRVELQVSAPMVESATLNGSGDIHFSAPVDSRKPLELTVNGSGDMDSRNIKVASLKATVNGSGDINLGDIEASRIQTTVNGSGDLTVAGIKAERANAAVNGSGDLSWRNVTADDIQTEVNGSGDVQLSDVTAQSVNGSVSGSGDLELNGCSEEAHYVLAGSGDISASRLKAKQVTARIAHGSGDIHCHASESIVMTQKRNGNSITYTGNPKRVERNNY
ncbi:hypothetical protein, secreted [gut metagenome]|uniref:Putative auto-transporter adhesin head GIN domain-containing protein n=1 Tax=gut metagenome TaxID=749906 RepID=J9H384_9ZZZZ